MNKTDSTIAQEKGYQDFITFTPKTLQYLTIEQEELVDVHLIIFRNLRNREMTAKEIHDLYFDKKAKKHGKTIKTIYRYLEKLEEAEVVTVAGHRITEGSRVAEKLYSRTAKIFIRKSAEDEMKPEQMDESAQIVTKLICALFNLENPNIDSFKEIFSKFFSFMTAQSKVLLGTLIKDEEIADFFAKTEIHRVNYVLDLAAIFGTLIKHPELIEQLRSLTS